MSTVFVDFQQLPVGNATVQAGAGLAFTGERQNMLFVLGRHQAMHFRRGGFSANAPLLTGPAFSLGFSFVSHTDAMVTLFSQGQEGEEGQLQVCLNTRYCPLKKELVHDAGNLLVFWLVKRSEKHVRYRRASCRVSKHLPVTLLLTGELGSETQVYVDGVLHGTLLAPRNLPASNSVLYVNPADEHVRLTAGGFYAANKATANPVALQAKLAAVLNDVPVTLQSRARALSLYHVNAAGELAVAIGRHQLARFSPVGLSKLMTLYIALQHIADASATVTVQEGDLMQGTGNNLEAGDVLTLEALLYNLALASSNTSANVLARIVGAHLPQRRAKVAENATQRFVRHMNTTARELGMDGVLFMNPSGTTLQGQQRITGKAIALLLAALVRQGRATSYYRLRRTHISIQSVTGSTRKRYISARFPMVAYSEPHFLFGHTGALISPGGYMAHTAGVATDGQGGHFIWVQLGMNSIDKRKEELGNMLHYLRLQQGCRQQS